MKSLILFLIIFFFQINLNAQKVTGEYLSRSTISAAGSSEKITIDNKKYIIQQSIGQPSAIGTFIEFDCEIRQGFIQPNVLAKIIDKKIPVSLQAILYPNPFVEKVFISFNEKVSNKIEVFVFDVLGSLVFSKSYNAEQNLEVDFNNLSDANYIIKIIANNKQFVESVIKI